MSCSIGGVVGKGSQRKRILVQIVGLGDERENKIAAANIVREIAEELTAEGIVTHVLNDGASIGIGMGLRSCSGVASGNRLKSAGSMPSFQAASIIASG